MSNKKTNEKKIVDDVKPGDRTWTVTPWGPIYIDELHKLPELAKNRKPNVPWKMTSNGPVFFDDLNTDSTDPRINKIYEILCDSGFFGDLDAVSGVNEIYEITSGGKIIINNNDNSSIKLGFSDDGKVRVESQRRVNDHYTNNVLSLNNFDGSLFLPRDISNLELELGVANGIISGDIAHPGILKAMNGTINLNLCAPLAVEKSKRTGETKITGMKLDRHYYEPYFDDFIKREMVNLVHRYVPINESPIGKIRASVKNGKMMINYNL